MGLAFDSPNLGCVALGYGFLSILEAIAEKNDISLHVLIFEKCNVEKIYLNGKYKRLQLESIVMPGLGSLKKISNHINEYKKCDYIFDFTAGDSFSDIYGLKNFIRKTFMKDLAIRSGTKFILGSQTYGPYINPLAKLYAQRIFKKSKFIFARDSISSKVVYDMSKRTPIQTVDVAFALPYNPEVRNENKTVIGINPSGLLWTHDSNSENNINLTIDYKKYCRELINRFYDDDNYQIVLVPHVISENMNQKDNDLIACMALVKEFPKLTMSPKFSTPVEAKSYISSLDVFTGARMHATIAALTSGVPVIPLSYSKKFEGLFGSVGYHHVISACNNSTEYAIEKTIHEIESIDLLKSDVDKITCKIKEDVNYIINQVEKVLMNS